MLQFSYNQNMATISLVSGILDAKSRITKLISTAGRAVLNSQFPNDFEYYLCALELVDANDENNVLEYFVFPIMPSEIRIRNTKLQSTTKTAGGTVTLENNTFVPVDINISGNFGRRLKTLAANGTSDLPLSITSNNVNSIAQKIGKGSIKVPEFSIQVKTGYGATKILERIYNRASEVIDGQPVLLYFYNFAFNAHYLVQPVDIQFSQAEGDSNMIWQYNMVMKGLAPANEIKTSDNYQDSMSKYVSQDVINKGVQSALDFVKDQKSVLQNQLLQKVGDVTGVDSALDRIPQLAKTISLP